LSLSAARVANATTQASARKSNFAFRFPLTVVIFKVLLLVTHSTISSAMLSQAINGRYCQK
jgi:hypothetical protein